MNVLAGRPYYIEYEYFSHTMCKLLSVQDWQLKGSVEQAVKCSYILFWPNVIFRFYAL